MWTIYLYLPTHGLSTYSGYLFRILGSCVVLRNWGKSFPVFKWFSSWILSVIIGFNTWAENRAPWFSLSWKLGIMRTWLNVFVEIKWYPNRVMGPYPSSQPLCTYFYFFKLQSWLFYFQFAWGGAWYLMSYTFSKVSWAKIIFKKVDVLLVIQRRLNIRGRILYLWCSKRY